MASKKIEEMRRPLPPKGGVGTVAVAIDMNRALVVRYRDGKVVCEFEQGVDGCLYNGIPVQGQTRPPRENNTGSGYMSERRMPIGCRRVSGDPRERAKTTIGSRL